MDRFLGPTNQSDLDIQTVTRGTQFGILSVCFSLSGAPNARRWVRQMALNCTACSRYSTALFIFRVFFGLDSSDPWILFSCIATLMILAHIPLDSQLNSTPIRIEINPLGWDLINDHQNVSSSFGLSKHFINFTRSASLRPAWSTSACMYASLHVISTNRALIMSPVIWSSLGLSSRFYGGKYIYRFLLG